MSFQMVNLILALIPRIELHVDEARSLQQLVRPVALLRWLLLLFYDQDEGHQNYLMLVL